MYLGLKHFRMPIETARVMPAVVSDEALRAMTCRRCCSSATTKSSSDPAQALERAHRLIPDFEGELVPGCRHDMCVEPTPIVDARVLEFLKEELMISERRRRERSVA